MTKLELATALSDQVPGLPLPKAIAATEGIIGIMSDALTRGHSITIRGFATIKPVLRTPRKAHNITTGETVNVPARRTVKLIPQRNSKTNSINERR